ncbi:NAD(P)H-quinone oxidoreductase [Saliniramus sp.]|uniref:NAD(P)H-quinone oxidoreductase n=1 Tax=Saliniramus sp. TaxID=2986772 RepID=UPI002CD34FD9|nr:NAD(P)H-quinone oxidoreductase [Saliniramus sp.]HMB12186.1 NAD(P)H-quinone oxidoreductase [Saliniramus sp.]
MTHPATMRAVIADGGGGPEVLKLVERPVPQPGQGEILVRVHAGGINRPDVFQRLGNYPPPPGASDILGLEIAGEVVACGEGATDFAPGDRVMALVASGGYAEYAVVAQDNAIPVPQGLSMVEAGAIPETYFTVWTNMFDRGGLQPGETVLIHGGSSGIGTTAIQLAKAFGATVFVTAGSQEKCAACLKLGADRAINYRDEDFVAVAKEATDGKGVPLIIDMVGGDYIGRNYDAAAIEGRIVQIAFLKGGKAEVDFRRLMVKRLHHTGSTLRPRSVAQKAEIAHSLREKVVPLLAEGRCKPIIDSTFKLEDVSKAHARMDSSAHIGKIVLTMAD